MADQEVRELVKAHLDEVLGAEVSRGLIQMIPDESKLATKADLELTARELRASMKELGGELRAEMGELRGELRGEMGELRGEMSHLRNDLGKLQNEVGGLRGAIGQLQGEVKAQQAEIVTSLTWRMWTSMATMAGLIFAGQGIALAVAQSL